MFTHMYIPSRMLWKGSDLIVCSREKALRSISLARDFSDGANGIFCIDQGKGIWKGGTWDYCLRDTKTWMSMYHTDFVSLMDFFWISCYSEKGSELPSNCALS